MGSTTIWRSRWRWRAGGLRGRGDVWGGAVAGNLDFKTDKIRIRLGGL
jgi:hypothetical protein